MYALYLRKSRSDKELEAKEDVLKRHEAALTELAKTNGYKIGAVYREVVSGDTIAARPQMQRLLAEVEKGMWDGVLVMEVERLARGSTIDQGIVSRAFALSNTLIITPARIYDPSDEFDEEYFEFGLFMSRREYKTINRRLYAGRLASCREGKYVGSIPPYGYGRKKLKGQKGWTLVPKRNEADIVKLVFSLYLSKDTKTGYGGIADKLEAMSVPTRSGKPWTAAQIKNILTNDVYIGKIHWGKTPEIKHTKNGELAVSRKSSANLRVFDGMHKAIIDEDTFNKVQSIIKDRVKAPVTSGRILKNALAGVLVCGICGRPLKRRGSSKPYYACMTVGCPVQSCRCDIIENTVNEIIRLKLGEIMLPEIAEANIDSNTDEAINRLCKKRLSELEKALVRTYELLEEGIYSTDIFLQRQKQIKTEIENILSTENQTYKERQMSVLGLPKNILQLTNICTDTKTKNILLRLMFYKIKYTLTAETASDGFTLEFLPYILPDP